MKKVFILVFALSLSVLTLSGCNVGINHYEDKLYSEKDINKNEKVDSIQDSNVLTREKAIEKALDIFDKGFNIKLNRKDLRETIRIIKGFESDDIYWSMTWATINADELYNCAMDACNGDIKRLSVYNRNKYKEDHKLTEKNYEIPEKEILEIIKPLFKELKIDISNYSIENSYYIINNKIPFKRATFKDVVSKKNGITVMIDCSDKTIEEFYIN